MQKNIFHFCFFFSKHKKSCDKNKRSVKIAAALSLTLPTSSALSLPDASHLPHQPSDETLPHKQPPHSFLSPVPPSPSILPPSPPVPPSPSILPPSPPALLDHPLTSLSDSSPFNPLYYRILDSFSGFQSTTVPVGGNNSLTFSLARPQDLSSSGGQKETECKKL